MNKNKTGQRRNVQAQSVKTASSAASPRPGSAASRTPEFNPDYSYVIKDLRRIGTLAGTFMVILVVLSFFLR